MPQTTVYGDPTWANTISNLGEMFSPKAEAEGNAMRARTKNWESEAGLNNAKAGLLGDRRKALSTEALKAAGMSPMQIAILQATQDDNTYNVARGTSFVQGSQGLTSGMDPRTAYALMGYAKEAADKDYAFTDGRADQLIAGAQAADLNKAAAVQRLKNAGDAAVAAARPVELSPGATALFAPGDVRNPNGVAKPLIYTPGQGLPPYRPGATTTPSQIFTAPALPGRGTSTGSGNPSADEAELLKKIQIEKAGGEAVASMGKYPIAGGAPMADAVTSAARAAFPTDTPSVAISKWMAANGVTVDDTWHMFGSNESKLMKGGKPLGIADLIAPNAPAAPAVGQPAAPAASAPVAPGQPAPSAPAANATGDVVPNAAGGIDIKGVPYNPGTQVAASLAHGQATHIIDKRTGKDAVAYWNAQTGKFQTQPVFMGNEDLGDFQSMRGENNWLGVIPAKDRSWAAEDVAKQALALGAIDPAALDAAMKADLASGESQVHPGYGRNVQKLLLDAQDKIVLAQRQKAMQDPRVAKYAAGNFAGDVGLPDDAMKLAEQIGINRAQFGIDTPGWSEGLPLGLGAVFAPSAYGDKMTSMPAGLQAFFQAVQQGRFDPKTLAVRPQAGISPVARQ